MIDFKEIDKALRLEKFEKKAKAYGYKGVSETIYYLADKFNAAQISEKMGITRDRIRAILETLGKRASVSRSSDGEKSKMWNTVDEKLFIDRMTYANGTEWLKSFRHVVKNRRYDRGILKSEIVDHIERRLGI